MKTCNIFFVTAAILHLPVSAAPVAVSQSPAASPQFVKKDNIATVIAREADPLLEKRIGMGYVPGPVGQGKRDAFGMSMSPRGRGKREAGTGGGGQTWGTGRFPSKEKRDTVDSILEMNAGGPISGVPSPDSHWEKRELLEKRANSGNGASILGTDRRNNLEKRVPCGKYGGKMRRDSVGMCAKAYNGKHKRATVPSIVEHDASEDLAKRSSSANTQPTRFSRKDKRDPAGGSLSLGKRDFSGTRDGGMGTNRSGVGRGKREAGGGQTWQAGGGYPGKVKRHDTPEELKKRGVTGAGWNGSKWWSRMKRDEGVRLGGIQSSRLTDSEDTSSSAEY